jgi:CBS domain-containing protein
MLTPLSSCPQVSIDATVGEAFQVMTHHNVGYVYVLSKDMSLLGIFTDGDFRRLLSESSFLIDQLFQLDVAKYASINPKSIQISDINELEQPEMLNTLAKTFTQNHIYDLPVIKGAFMVGSISIQSLLQLVVFS